MASEGKKPKLEEDGSEVVVALPKAPDVQEELTSFEGFTIKKILSDNSERKSVSIEGTFTDGRRAIVVLERLPLREELLPQILQVCPNFWLDHFQPLVIHMWL